MLRGAFLFAAGLALGYAKATADVPRTQEFLDALQDAWAKANIKADGDQTIYPQGEASQ